MRLSELVERCKGSDPELMIPGPDGIPVPVVDIDHGITVNLAQAPPRRSRHYVELLPVGEGEDD